MRNKRRVLIEALEQRVMMSITDADTSFGNAGNIAAVPRTNGYVMSSIAPDGDVIQAYGTSKPATSTTPPVYYVKVSDVSPSGQIRWTGTIDLSSSEFYLYPIQAKRLSDGSVVVEVNQDYGNESEDIVEIGR